MLDSLCYNLFISVPELISIHDIQNVFCYLQNNTVLHCFKDKSTIHSWKLFYIYGVKLQRSYIFTILASGFNVKVMQRNMKSMKFYRFPLRYRLLNRKCISLDRCRNNVNGYYCENVDLFTFKMPWWEFRTTRKTYLLNIQILKSTVILLLL